MTTILLSVISPLVFFFLSMVLSKKLKVPVKTVEKRSTNKSFTKWLIIALFTEIIVFSSLSVIIEKFYLSDERQIPFIIILFCAFLPFGALLAGRHLSDERIVRLLQKTAVCAIALLLAEVVVFNGKSFASEHVSKVIGSDAIITEGLAEKKDGSIIISGDASLILNDVPKGTQGLILRMNQEKSVDSLLFNAELSIKDGNLSNSYVVIQDKYTKAYNEDLTFSFDPYGEIYSLKISFNSITKPIAFRFMRAVSALPFEFSLMRYFFLLGAALLLIAIKELRLYKITYQENKIAHTVLTWAMVVLCTWSAMFFYRPEQKLVDYSSTNVRTDDPYSMVFDAFQKKQVHLDYEADTKLEEIENVYDYSQRQQSDAFALWDFAYYEGKYYVYFGVAPVLTCYYPVYLITGKLPTIAMANAIYGSFAIFFLCMTILATVRFLKPRANLLLLLVSMPASASALGVYMLLNSANLYDLPIASGLCFLFLSLWLGLGACSERNKVLRLIKLFFGGLSLALCVASRPGMALGSAVLIPVFLGVLKNGKMKLSYRIGQACSFLVPLLVGGLAIMWYNHARFGSPFDFGSAYQLTVSDVSANTVRFSSFPAMLYHYFLQIPRPKQSFPFIEEQFCSLNNYGTYMYTAGAVGALSYPLILLGAVMIPIALHRKKRVLSNGASTLQRNAFIIISFVTALFLGWINFCLGGVHQRYVTDLMPLLILGSVMVILLSTGNPQKNKYRYILSGLGMAATFCIGWLLVLGNREGNLIRHCPNLYEIVENLVIFWR